MLTPDDTRITTLGERNIPSPLRLSTVHGDGVVNFVPEHARSRYTVEIKTGPPDPTSEIYWEMAGPREKLFFDPANTTAAIVTCGGLCPGLNNVIRSIFLQLHYGYGVGRVLGIRFGYAGLSEEGHEPIELTTDVVEDIHREGGTMLGSSRGPGDVSKMVDFLRSRKVDILFTVGGDGTQAGAHRIAREILDRKLPLAVVGIPKTIDNDIRYVQRTFGFSTAVEVARKVIDSAHNESHAYENCVSIVKLMGRSAGYIAAAASVASQDVNFCLVPEVPFRLEGKHGLLACLKERILRRGHAVVVVAEGAGQDILAEQTDRQIGTDASGNPKLLDIGPFLKDRIAAYFRQENIPANFKYIDPSYTIRSVPADGDDSVLCDTFARSAVHAAMAGRTDMVVGLWHGVFIHVPTELIACEPKRMNVEGELWRSVLAATGQPIRLA